ncbi:hypothetical protein ES703_19683 [subsurface metagenome]
MGFQPGGVKEFIKLDDTPGTFSGQAAKGVKVNTAQTALEFATIMAGLKVRQNSGDVIGTRPQLNLHQGAGVILTVTDDPASDEIDVVTSVRDVDKFIPLIPNDASLPSTGGAARETVDGTNFSYDVLDFDAAGNEKASWQKKLSPNYLDENVHIKIYWITTAITGNCKWGVKMGGRKEDDVWDSALGAQKTVVTAAKGTAGQIAVSELVMIPSWTKEDVVIFELERLATDGEDTMAADARVLKMVPFYTLKVPLGQAFYEVTPHVDVTPAPMGTWEDADVSAYVPIGATAAIFELNAGEAGRYFGLRKKGSTDDSYWTMGSEHAWAIVGLDDNRVFQMKRQTTETAKAYLVGYCGEGVIYHTNSPHTFENTDFNVWEVKDLSGYCPGAIGVILEVTNDQTAALNFGVRKHGSSDDFYDSVWTKGHHWILIGCDENQKIDVKSADYTKLSFRVLGYVTTGAYFYTNAVVQSLSTADEAWHDLPNELHDQAIFGFFEVVGTGTYDIRKKSGEANHYTLNNNHGWAIIPCDIDKKCEGKISTVAVDFYQIGFGTAAE